MDVSQLSNITISVIGAARSGIGAALLLQKAGAKIFVSDLQPAEKVADGVRELRTRGITVETGGHSERVYDCGLMVISPGVPSDAPVIVEARRRGVRVVSEIEVASWFCRAPIVAITGSNGKTTTTTLLGRILGDAKKKHVVAGNIGEAFSNFVLDLAETDVVALEVSSFQLDGIETFRPAVSVILNITRNHMDRYGNSMERYAASKARIFMNQRAGDLLIASADDDWTGRATGNAQCRTVQFSTARTLTDGSWLDGDLLRIAFDGKATDLLRVPEMSMRGEHNVQNAMAASLAAMRFGISPASIRATLKNFKGVEHRQEFVAEVKGVRYINDSKATTVEAVRRALNAFDEPIILILGGKDKGNDYTEIADIVRRKVKAIVATGASAPTIEKFFGPIVKVVRVDTIGSEKPNRVSMERTVEAASSLAVRGDVVLLSPACTSFDWFTDYEERGRVFKEAVRHMPAA